GRVAQIQDVPVLNVNDLANALKPALAPGERLNIHIMRRGEQEGQGVGYLDDGTMVVVEGGAERLNEMSEVEVTSTLQTSAGRMIFARRVRPEGEQDAGDQAGAEMGSQEAIAESAHNGQEHAGEVAAASTDPVAAGEKANGEHEAGHDAAPRAET